ncbi:hypothetical protein MUK42_24358 [Musa troglodytarum]|uniref:Uncharacterized protein n=1 Tax=Musa troglodytarum TaxID=320322 RepID=A0A9E7GAX9_9LILI|nr:hypothetical protein MUK42_24358 [Musa troglodytarum]
MILTSCSSRTPVSARKLFIAPPTPTTRSTTSLTSPALFSSPGLSSSGKTSP